MNSMESMDVLKSAMGVDLTFTSRVSLSVQIVPAIVQSTHMFWMPTSSRVINALLSDVIKGSSLSSQCQVYLTALSSLAFVMTRRFKLSPWQICLGMLLCQSWVG